MDSFYADVRRDAAFLRRVCRQELQRTEMSVQGRCLTDNYHLLQAAATDAQRLFACRRRFSDAGRKDRRRLFSLCFSLSENGALPEKKVLLQTLDEAALSIADCREAAVFLAAAVICHAAQAVRAEDDKRLLSAIRSLQILQETDFESCLSAFSEAERLLLQDPTGHYKDMDEVSKQRYRTQVEKLSYREGVSQTVFLHKILAEARAEGRHIGFFLELCVQRDKKGIVFCVCEAAAAVLLTVLLAAMTGEPATVFLLFLPVFAIVRPLADRLSVRLSENCPVLSMKPQRCIPESCRTLLTVAGILPCAADTEALEKHLEQLFTANAHGAVRLLFLADPAPASSPETPTDQADIAAVCRVIDRLNERHGGGFAVAVRNRVFSPTQGQYTAFERKRGALLTLAGVIVGESGYGFPVLHGDLAQLHRTKYLFTLDADTTLSFDTLSFVCAAARHPLNRPRTDAAFTRVESGYGIIVPAARVSLQSAAQSLFSVLMNDGGGASAYAAATAERGMSLFGSSNFTGKGLVNVRLFFNLCRGLPQQYILSHDCLEGGILRTAFDGRGSFVDSFPKHEKSYFERLHRWLRGDWQNVRFLFFPVGKCRLPLHTKLLLADNLRRAVTPVATAVLLAAGVFFTGSRALLLQGIALLSVCAAELPHALSTVFSQGILSLFSRSFSGSIPGVAGVFVRCLLLIGMLPQTAACAASAAVRALWRMLISHKRLLEWKTAAQSDSFAAAKPLQSLVFPLCFAAVLAMTPSATARTAALLFVANTVFSFAVGGRRVQRVALRQSQKDVLLADCAAMWRFFEENAGEEDHFLPPDNLQETPVFDIAHRTSPTNIGLYLCCILAAADFSFLDARELCTRLSRTLDTVEKLEKKNGHLLNWYDTRTLQALQPRYVSTVDSGNFLCCLAALEQGLTEYLPACPQLQTQIDRIRRLQQQAELSVLYNPDRRLFYVGMDADTGEKSGSCYDLYMSEARMTSYYAVASGQVPGEHWRRLGRTVVRKDGFSGAVSWTGTFFEYFMPCLFLSVPVNSFSSESLAFCLYVQRRTAAAAGIPWGITESGYYACDSSLHYAYKAHGVRTLALKRAADCDPVAAPYASYLALLHFPRAAFANLRRLRGLHLYGRYGFCEAADFTPSRTNGEDYCAVRSYMAHHVGMSLLGAANCLSDGLFVHRFMHNPRMAAAADLTEERAGVCTRTVRNIRRGGMPQRPQRPDRREQMLCENVFFSANGEWTSLADSFGRNVQIFAGRRLLHNRNDCGGVCVAVLKNREVFPLAAEVSCKAEFSASCVTSQRRCEGLLLRCAQTVHKSFSAAMFPVRIDNESKTRQQAAVCFYLEPFLMPVFAADNHPAYSRLFVSCLYDKDEKIFIFGRQDASVGLFMAVGLWDGADFSFETDREQVLVRGGAQHFPVTAAFENLSDGLSGTDRCLALHIPVSLRVGESIEHTLLLTAAATPSEAAQKLRQLRRQALPSAERCAANPFARQPRLGHTAENICAQLFFGAEPGETVRQARLASFTRADLWAAGVSGDVPLVMLETQAVEERQQLVDFTALQARMTALGIAPEFVFVRGRKGGYADTPEQLLRDAAAADGRFAQVLPKGLQKSSLTQNTLSALRACSLCVLPQEQTAVSLPRFQTKEERLPVTPAAVYAGALQGGWQFVRQPTVPWCITQSNAVFGFLASDSSPGCTWAGNAQRNKLTPWKNDTRAQEDGEEILAGIDGQVFSLCRGAACRFTDTEAVYEGLAHGISVRVCVQTDAKAQRKRLSVHLKNTLPESKTVILAYSLQPLLAASEAEGRFVRAWEENGSILLHNPFNTDVPGFACLYGEEGSCCAFSEEELFCVLRQEGSLQQKKQAVSARRTAVCITRTLPSGGSTAAIFGLSFARTREALQKLAGVPFLPKKPLAAEIRTGDKELDSFGNALLLHTVSDTRFSARCGYYQCGGAWGFRDQLQDALCLLAYKPQLTRRQILRCAAVQFEEGDVLHWHHALFVHGAKRTQLFGVRTRCSDDLVWLPFVTACYVLHTKDIGILGIRTAALSAPPLQENEKDRYARYERGEKKTSLYAHCLQALSRACRFGERGLPLMGSGDWNDAMNAVGDGGKGESVWLAMFLSMTLDRFSQVCDLVGDSRHAGQLRALAAVLRTNTDRCAWEEDRYLRAFFDDGTPLGSRTSPACTLDVLPQAFAVFGNMPDKARVRSALAVVCNRLFDRSSATLRLFETPFTPQTKYAGYINFYPVGVRENGGQYTHAAVWFAIALLQAGYREQAMEIARAICPNVRYARDEEAAHRVYRAEPYAPCGDVAAQGALAGRGGWSLYTGSAGWLLVLLRLLSQDEK